MVEGQKWEHEIELDKAKSKYEKAQWEWQQKAWKKDEKATPCYV